MLHSWKFAANGVWEEALTVSVVDLNSDTITKWVAANPQNIAFEPVFAEHGTPATMFGIRITSLPKAEQIARIAKIVAKTPVIKSETDFLKAAAEIFPEYALFKNKPKALNIGIVGQWYSVGPEVIWSPSMPTALSVDELQEKAPRFFEPTRNPAAIEAWHTQPIDHWYKIYISDQHNGMYVLNPEKYQDAVGKLNQARQ